MSLQRQRVVWTAALACICIGTLLLARHFDADRVQRGTAAGGAKTMVPVELVLLVDTSGSVDDDEYRLQKDGYEDAFRSSELGELIEAQGGIVVTYIEWSRGDHQDVRIDWTHLKTRSDCYAFAGQIGAIVRTTNGSTKMAPALQFAADRIAANNYISLKAVIDVSGDGRCENYDWYAENAEYSPEDGPPWADVIANISGVVDVVNGICITTDETIVEFYRDVLPQGSNSFMMQVDTFDQFDDAILEKLRREISNLPGMFD